jgi:hypothetical protein
MAHDALIRADPHRPGVFLPGLLFCVFRGLGVRNSVAWHWMWLLPGGYCYLLQAGSIGNDAFATVFLLASIHFALRAAKSNKATDLACSVAAAALLTSAKASNLPLLLPWAVALWPARRLLLSRTIALVVGPALVISFLPIAILNLQNTGHWNGNIEELDKLRARNPLAGVIGNSMQLAAQNVAPPINPFARQTSDQLTAMLLASRGHWLERNFPRFNLGLGEMPQEESAGVGLGVTFLAGVGVIGAFAFRRRRTHLSANFLVSRPGLIVALSNGAALLFFMTQLASEATARLLTPYYPLLLIFVLLLPGQAWLARSFCWRSLAVMSNSVALAIVVLTPSRPLWPAQTVWSWLGAKYPDNHLIQRAATAYSVYARRADNLAALRQEIPAGTRRIGFLSSGDESDISLWRPFDGRRVWHFDNADSPDEFRKKGVEILVVQSLAFGSSAESRLNELLATTGGRLVSRKHITLKVRIGPEEWWIIALSHGCVTGI